MRKRFKHIGYFVIILALFTSVHFIRESAKNHGTMSEEKFQKEYSIQYGILDLARSFFIPSENQYNNPIVKRYYIDQVNEIFDEAERFVPLVGDINNIDKKGVKNELNRFGTQKGVEEIEDILKDEGFSIISELE